MTRDPSARPGLAMAAWSLLLAALTVAALILLS
jgi:hypothetical protein